MNGDKTVAEHKTVIMGWQHLMLIHKISLLTSLTTDSQLPAKVCACETGVCFQWMTGMTEAERQFFFFFLSL